jgi:hypothetical protein
MLDFETFWLAGGRAWSSLWGSLRMRYFSVFFRSWLRQVRNSVDNLQPYMVNSIKLQDWKIQQVKKQFFCPFLGSLANGVTDFHTVVPVLVLYVNYHNPCHLCISHVTVFSAKRLCLGGVFFLLYPSQLFLCCNNMPLLTISATGSKPFVFYYAGRHCRISSWVRIVQGKAFWVVTLCNAGVGYWCFWGSCFLHIQGKVNGAGKVA